MPLRTHVGVSLDGFITSSEGLPAWDAMPNFGPESYGVQEFTDQCDAIIVGRTNFDQGFEFWLTGWPWLGKPVYVLTSHPLPEKAAEMRVIASMGGPERLVEQIRQAGLKRDVHVHGGARTIRAFLEIGALDELGIVVLPVLLGKGIPLFETAPVAFSQEAWDAYLASPQDSGPRPHFQLDRHRAFPDGAIELVYRKAS